MALAAISANKRHLVNPKGHPFFVFGVNYVGYFDRAWKMWNTDLYDPELIVRDFRKAKNSGFNVMRLFARGALIEDIRKDNFTKLDETLSNAQDHDLLVLLTLNDVHALNLEDVGQVDAKIVARYQEVPTIFGYDLEDEPVFYNLAAAIYPKAYHPPIQTSQLIDHYGVRVEREEVAELQRQRRVPGHLDEDIAFYYINALRLFLEYDTDVRAFVKQSRGTLVDFMLSKEAERWHTLIGVLDGTVEAWLQARIDPIRATGCRHMVTVGWHWLHFAGLPANRRLDFQSYHNFTPLSLPGFNTNIAHLESLQRAFPKHPILLSSFGWSNQTSQETTHSHPVHPKLTALYEATTYTFLRANAFAGGIKWVLNDIDQVANPREASFGVFSVGDVAKPIRDLTHHFSQTWPSIDQKAHLRRVREVEAGFSYRFDLPHQITIGGYIYQDEAISWRGEGVAHCFIKLEKQELIINAQGAGLLSIDPWALIPTWNRARPASLYRIYGENQRTRQGTFEVGQSVVVDIRPGAQYVIAMSVEAPLAPPAEDAPQLDPQPGEHGLLLGDFETYLPGALEYIRRFAPDFTFAVDEVAGRWAYVSIIAPPEQVPAEILENIRSRGAFLVERVVGDTPEATKAMLDEMARRGQRFLTAFAPIPPQEEPPADVGEPEPPGNGVSETYIVQPGDTLSKIAQQTYGDVRLWPLIFEANQDKISNPSLIRVGMELHIPVRE